MRQAVKLFIIWMLASLTVSTSFAWAQPSQTKDSDFPSAPDTGTPENDSSPGGTRIDKNSSCKPTKKALTSLLSVGDFTLSEYPSFWFYIPYTPEEIKDIEFILKDESSRVLYQTFVKLTDKPGIIKIALPPEQKYSLEIQKNYNWSLNVKCVSNTSARTDLVLNGAIRRLSNNPELENKLRQVKSEEYLVYIENYIYYDAVTNLASLYQSNLENNKFKEAWNNLLVTLGRKDLIGEPIVNSSLR
jgi:Domain of Unknown Function (DUF928)